MAFDQHSVERYWSRQAAVFDRLYQDTSPLERTVNRVFRPNIYLRAKVVVDEVQRLGQPSVLDVGSGSGANSLAFAAAGATNVVGVDFAEPMLELARKRAASDPYGSSCHFERGDFTTWDPRDQADIVAALGVFDYVENARDFWSKMLRSAKRSAIASFPSPRLRGWIRKVRYNLKGCPLFLYDERDVERWTRDEGWVEFEVPQRNSSGFTVVARRE